jgi:fructan beta-fructosidase
MRTLLILAGMALPTFAYAVDPDILIADFEGDTYGDWKVEGKAFGEKPARGTLPGQMAVSGFRGKGLVNSFVGGDSSKGTLTSPKFTIEREYLNFLIGGGKHEGQTCMNLLLDGKIVRTATGPNDQPGGSEELKPAHWNVRDLKGKSVVLQIVDAATGGWGHINVDQIVQSDAKTGDEAKAVPLEDRSVEVAITKKYLMFPIGNTAKAVRMTIEVEGRIVHDFDINLAMEKADWSARMEVPQFVGKTAKITARRVPKDARPLLVLQSDVADNVAARFSEPKYNEALRPQLRFSQLQGWNNDPNGMVYHDGEYHLFWQSNPFGPKWGNMYWGHAVSKDLIHWEELPYALYPRVMAKSHCFSGSAHVDTHNTGGWGKDAMIAAFTDTGAGECLAVSTDKGRTWKYIERNPVIGQRKDEGRDPKLIWYEPGQHWVIAVYTKTNGKDYCEFYSSRDLTRWERTSRIEGYYECPEFIELPVDGDAKKKRWVLFAADAEYAVGSFDGKTFTPEHTGKRKVHYGAIYAAQCFNRAPGGRAIQIGWARVEMPNMPFNQAFTLPIELTLKTTKDGVRLFANPVKELEKLRGQPGAVMGRWDDRAINALPKLTGTPVGYDIVAESKHINAKEDHYQFGENIVVYDFAKQTLDGMPLPLVDGKYSVRIIVDTSLYEIVGNDGAVYKTVARKDAGKPIKSISTRSVGGSSELISFIPYPMKSIWK